MKQEQFLQMVAEVLKSCSKDQHESLSYLMNWNKKIKASKTTAPITDDTTIIVVLSAYMYTSLLPIIIIIPIININNSYKNARKLKYDKAFPIYQTSIVCQTDK